MPLLKAEAAGSEVGRILLQKELDGDLCIQLYYEKFLREHKKCSIP